MGTPEFAVPSLAGLLEAGHDVTGVVTQPDRPQGRGQRLQMPAVKRFAVERGLTVLQPEKIRNAQFLEALRPLAPELIVVAAYGKILPPAVLELPPRGCVNVHASLLPKYRGAAPIQRCLLEGDPVTGVTIMQMNEGMDTGDILLQREVTVDPEDTAGSLQSRLATVGASALLEALDRLARGELRAVPQRNEHATLAPMIRKEEGEIDWSRSAVEIERSVRAFQPWPGAFTRANGALLKVLRAAMAPNGESKSSPGTVVAAEAGALRVATGKGDLDLLEVQPEGKRRMTARDVVSGRLLRAGDRLGS